MSVPEHMGERSSSADTVAGFLAAIAIFGGAACLFYHPGRLGPAAILIALIAVGLGRHVRRLTAFAMVCAVAGFFFGMIIAVVFDHPIF